MRIDASPESPLRDPANDPLSDPAGDVLDPLVDPADTTRDPMIPPVPRDADAPASQNNPKGVTSMQVRDVMTREVETIAPDASLQEAADLMKTLDVGPLPVCDVNNKLAGMVTDRDLVVRGLAEGGARGQTVRDVMTEGVTYCFEDDDVERAAKIMQEQQIRRLVVLDRNKNLVGLVSLGDLATKGGAAENAAGQALTQISEPAEPNR